MHKAQQLSPQAVCHSQLQQRRQDQSWEHDGDSDAIMVHEQEVCCQQWGSVWIVGAEGDCLEEMGGWHKPPIQFQAVL